MLTSEKKDSILRLIEETFRALAGALGRLRAAGDTAGVVRETESAVGRLLGPLGAVAPRMDSATAAQMVGDPDLLEAWSRLEEDAAAARAELGDEAGAARGRRRALELALEAHLRTARERPELHARIERLRAAAEASPLAPRHAEALDAFPGHPREG